MTVYLESSTVIPDIKLRQCVEAKLNHAEEVDEAAVPTVAETSISVHLRDASTSLLYEVAVHRAIQSPKILPVPVLEPLSKTSRRIQKSDPMDLSTLRGRKMATGGSCRQSSRYLLKLMVSNMRL
jgi:hypothetical protein